MNRQHIGAQLLLRAWPFPRGAGRIVDRFFSNISFIGNEEMVRTTDGFEMSIPLDDAIGRQIYLTGEFDRSIVEVILEFSELGDILLDIGSNVGYVSACFLHNIPNSHAIAVEPQPYVVDLLRKNLSQFQNRHQIFELALSDNDGEVNFLIDSRNRGKSRIVDIGTPETRCIKTRSGDRFFSDLNLSKLDIVKIDVEGHEDEILTVCRQHLERLQPKLVLFEGTRAKADPGGSIGKLLNEIGYGVFGIQKRLSRLKLCPILDSVDRDFNDYVAISRRRPVSSTARLKYSL